MSVRISSQTFCSVGLPAKHESARSPPPVQQEGHYSADQAYSGADVSSLASRLRRTRSIPLRSTEPVPVSSAEAVTIADAGGPAVADRIVIAPSRDGVGLQPCGGSVALL